MSYFLLCAAGARTHGPAHARYHSTAQLHCSTPLSTPQFIFRIRSQHSPRPWGSLSARLTHSPQCQLMTALSKHQGKYSKPCPVRQREVSSPTLASSSLSSTCSLLLYSQGLSGGCQSGERHDGWTWEQETKPSILPTWTISPWSIPSLSKQLKAGNHLSRSPRDLRAADSFPRPLLPVVAPSPGVPISWGLPPLWLTSGSLALWGSPISGPWAHAQARGHSPARRQAERGSRRQEPRLAARAVQTRTPQPARPALAPEVTFGRAKAVPTRERARVNAVALLGSVPTWWPRLCNRVC